jgi:aspartate/methionine/tyrosine aminotransferase
MSIRMQDIGKAVIETEYAVRGPIVARAQQLERQGREIIYCNIGNPQALEQKPLTYLRQVLALCQYPDLIERGADLFPADVRDTARRILEGTRYGLGAYSDSKGVRFVRDAVAAFIRERDEIETDPEAIYLTDGASKGVQTALRILISGPQDGIMIPIPQYPLYSATITLYEGKQVGYYLDESILADEVYQENIYLQGDRFVSFAKVMVESGETDVSLFSFHSCSKGFLGECGQRGGYMEVRNIPADVAAQITKLQSVSLCANLTGQVATYCMVRPPKPGEPSYERYARERDAVLGELRSRAVLLADGLNRIPGIQCNVVAGAMYAFPRITLPAGRTDEQYCMDLLEQTGICVVAGTGFGQIPGTAHFRTTILPPTSRIRAVVERLAAFHATYR